MEQPGAIHETRKGCFIQVITIPFDVNDNVLRETFFKQLLPDAIEMLGERTPPQWGNMTVQHMIEHLLWAFECSTGTLVVPCKTPAALLERAKRFLHDARETPHGFKNPLLGEQPPPLRFPGIAEAKTALLQEVRRFITLCRDHPEAVQTHPVFGPLGAEEWHRSHFKHCHHHLQQFGLIAAPGEGTPGRTRNDSSTPQT
jgi:hypothetical protein